MRGWLFVALTLAAAAQAVAQPSVDLTPAWDGWSRAGRATEVEVRLRSDRAARGALEVAGGGQVSRATVDLPAGRAVAVNVPVGDADRLTVTFEVEGGHRARRELVLARSEAPLFGLAVASGEAASLEGFHTVVLDPGDFPRNTSAYASIDAVAVDSPTLLALDERQLGALLGFAAACGRLALVGHNPGVRRVLEGAAGCGAGMLARAGSLREATAMLQQSLAMPATPAATAADLGALGQPDLSPWRRVLVMLAVYVGVAALALTLSASTIVALLVPATASVVVLAMLHAWTPAQRLVVWAEATPASRVAQYQAWQRSTGLLRGRLRLPVLAGLDAPRTCESGTPARFDFDTLRGRQVSATFDTRLFQAVALCYAGTFPVERAVEIAAHSDTAAEIRNAGTLAWPAGLLTAAGRVHPLPALGPGKSVTVQLAAADGIGAPAAEAALARTPRDGYAAAWPLELGSVTQAPRDSMAWLLVPVPP